ncbi:MAG: hypothetical protein GX591_14050 [Planctomycetes bacterium]|nr:hypothetical protein [Planctomycetota bacterium]
MNRVALSIVLACVPALATAAAAEIFCVRPDGAVYGNGSGADWANALSGFPPPDSGPWGAGEGWIDAGDTILVAAGDYTTSVAPPSGGASEQARLTIRRATAADHGPHAGWTADMDGVVRLVGSASITLSDVDYVTVDGVTEYGFHLLNTSTYGLSVVSGCSHILVQGVRADGSVQQDNYRGFNLRDSHDVIVRRCWSSNNPNDSVLMMGMNGAVLEHCRFGPRIPPIDYAWHADLIEARNNTNIDFRYNNVDWAPDGVFLFEGNTHWRIYGNIFRGGGKGTRTHSTNPVNGPVHVHNNVFYQSYQGVSYGSAITGTACNNVFYGNLHAPGFGGLTAGPNYYYNTEGKTNTGGDPFVNAAALDFHLRAATPAVDEGAALGSPFDLDADGATRPQGGGWDMGPFEYLPVPGDADGDGDVDLDDFGSLKRSFGRPSGAVWADGDFNGDGTVDLDDFVLLKQNFGTRPQ